LSEENISVSSLNSFKHRLEKRRNRQMEWKTRTVWLAEGEKIWRYYV